MKLLTHATAIAAIAAAGATLSIASAQSPAATQTVVRAGSQPAIDGPAANFTGRVRVEPVFPATADAPFSAGYVTFEPGARSAWHTHPAGQRLIVTAGNGRTGVWGGPVVEIKAGDAVLVPTRREALARCGTRNGDDTPGTHRAEGRRQCALARTRDRRAVREVTP